MMADGTATTAPDENRVAVPETPGSILSVSHRTTFHYAEPVTQSVNTLHLVPRTFPYQKTIASSVRVTPVAGVRKFTDLFQNITHHFELPAAHSELEIASMIKVHNLPLEISAASRDVGLDGYADASVKEVVWPYLQDSRWVSRHPDVWRQAVDIARSARSVFAQAGAMMSWIHEEFRYEPGSTNVSTHLEETFAMRCGVCQDFTHVMLGLCRSVGISARYASGYLYNGPADTLVGAQASHAWAEVYLPGAGWIGFDPTNNNLADERYVKVAVGRDYDDVSPVRGSYLGTGHCRMEVLVEVEKTR